MTASLRVLDNFTGGTSYNIIIKDGEFLFLLLRVSHYYAIIRQVQLDDYYFTYKQNAWSKPGRFAPIIGCAPRTCLVIRVIFSMQTLTPGLLLSYSTFEVQRSELTLMSPLANQF